MMMNSSSPKKTIHDKSWVIGIDDDEILQALKQFMTNHQICIFFTRKLVPKKECTKPKPHMLWLLL
jgi:hypothetical protein